MQIKTIIAAEMLDSRGNPTVEAQVILVERQLGKTARFAGKSAFS